MQSQTRDSSRTDDIRFLGRIVAGQSHDVTNVLTIINELVGLQTDLVHGAERDSSVDVSKLAQVNDKIRHQVARGKEIVKKINWFAHSVDVAAALFDVREALSSIVFLTERWTRLNNTKLVTTFPQETTAVEMSPFAFAQAVFWSIETAMSAAQDSREVTVSYTLKDGGVEIAVRNTEGQPADADISQQVASLRSLIDRLGGNLRLWPEQGQSSEIVFFIPCGDQHGATGKSSSVTEDR